MKKEKNILIRLFFSKSFFLLSIILILFLTFIFLKAYNENKETNQNLELLKNKIKNLEKSNQEFSQLIEYFNSNSFVEKEAREKLGLKKDGEKVVAVLEDHSHINKQYDKLLKKNISDNNKKNIFFPKMWLDYFLKIKEQN